MTKGGGYELINPTTLELSSFFLSAAAHDVDHPGHNNLFESKTKSKLAMLYND